MRPERTCRKAITRMHWFQRRLRRLTSVFRRRELNEVRQILEERCLEFENKGRDDDAAELRRLKSAPELAEYRLIIKHPVSPEEMVPSLDSRELYMSIEEIRAGR